MLFCFSLFENSFCYESIVKTWHKTTKIKQTNYFKILRGGRWAAGGGKGVATEAVNNLQKKIGA